MHSLKKSCSRSSHSKKAEAVFIIVNIIMYRIISKKVSRSELIAEISDAIKKKYINVSFDFILK